MPSKQLVKMLTIAILFLIFTDSTTVDTTQSDPDSGMTNGKAYKPIRTIYKMGVEIKLCKMLKQIKLKKA